jgi:hypothetical protein
MIEIAHAIGTHAVIKSPHLDRLTPRVSRRGRVRMLHHRIVDKNVIKKKQIKNMNKNHNQYQYCKICKKCKSVCIYEGDARKGSG